MDSKFRYAEAIYRTKMDPLCHGVVQLPHATLASYHGEAYSFVLKVLSKADPQNEKRLSQLDALIAKWYGDYKVLNSRKSQAPTPSSSVQNSEIITDGVGRLTVSNGKASLHIGLYLDEDEFVVGSFDPAGSATEPKILIRGPPVFAITNGENEVKLGSEAEICGKDWKPYDLLKLLKAQETFTHTVMTQNSSRVSTTEIVSKFFQQICVSVKRIQGGTTVVSSIVITLPFTSTCLERKRLEGGAKLCGIQNVRIISSPLATALAYSLKSRKFAKNPQPKDEFLLSVQYLKQSFSMAIIRLGPWVVSTRCAFGSVNMPQGQDPQFLTAHARLFQTSMADSTERQEQIFRTYKKALEQLISESTGCRLSSCSVIATASKETVMNVTLGRYLQKEISTFGVEQGPLMGACVLAAAQADIQIPAFPPTVKVVEVSRADLLINFNGKEWKVNFRNQKLSAGLVFYHNFDAGSGNKNYIIVQEEFCQEPALREDASIRFVSVEEKSASGTIRLTGKVNENGVYLLELESKPGIIARLIRPDERFTKSAVVKSTPETNVGHSGNTSNLQFTEFSSGESHASSQILASLSQESNSADPSIMHEVEL